MDNVKRQSLKEKCIISHKRRCLFKEVKFFHSGEEVSLDCMNRTLALNLLKSKIREIELFYDQCFYIAIKYNGRATELIYWNYDETEKVEWCTDRLEDIQRNGVDKCIYTGCMNEQKLLRWAKDKLGKEYKCNEGYTRFHVIKFDVEKFEKLPDVLPDDLPAMLAHNCFDISDNLEICLDLFIAKVQEFLKTNDQEKNKDEFL